MPVAANLPLRFLETREPLARKRFEMVSYLKAHGIGTSVYYPSPVPHLTYYRNRYGCTNGSFPVAARLSNNSISLPVGPNIGPDDIDYMVATIKDAIMEVKKE